MQSPSSMNSSRGGGGILASPLMARCGLGRGLEKFLVALRLLSHPSPPSRHCRRAPLLPVVLTSPPHFPSRVRPHAPLLLAVLAVLAAVPLSFPSSSPTVDGGVSVTCHEYGR